MQKSIYTIPKLVKAKEGWYVYLRYNSKKKVYKADLNKISNLKEREREANVLIKVLYEQLKSGWNPLDKTQSLLNSMRFLDALDYAIEKKKENLAPKTYLDYSGTIRYIKKATNDCCLDFLEIKEVKRIHIKTIIHKAKTNRSWSNKSYNKNLNYLKAVLSELIQWDILEVNPAHNIKNLPTEESRSNIPATPEQHKIIKECLENNHPEFYKFVVTIFHCGIRPKEILMIRLSMIDLNKQQIVLPPEITKTNKERIVPINTHLLSHYLEMDLHIYPKDFYLFGSYRQNGAGNRGKYIDFIPAPTPIKRDTATKKWYRIVKKGLKIDVNLYSNKHAGANAKILAGIDLDALRELYGHSSKLMTLNYAKVVKEVNRKEIINKSPKF